MRTHLVTGGCGFVGRNMVKRLYRNTTDRILFIDDLSVGIHPREWLGHALDYEHKGLEAYGKDERLFFLKADLRDVLRSLNNDPEWIHKQWGLDMIRFADVFHFAAILGGP